MGTSKGRKLNKLLLKWQKYLVLKRLVWKNWKWEPQCIKTEQILIQATLKPEFFGKPHSGLYDVKTVSTIIITR